MYADPMGFETVSLSTDFKTLLPGYYGGNQSWWNNKGLKTNDKYRENRGCGPVAGANVMLYLAKVVGFTNLYPYAYTQLGFLNIMNDMWKSMAPTCCGVTNMAIYVKGVLKYAKGRKVSLTAHWSPYGTMVTSAKKLDNTIKFVKEGLRKDCPVSLAVHGNSKLKVGTQSFSWHFMVITEITDNRNDKGEGPVTITVSSWAAKYTLDFRQVVKSSYWRMTYFT